LTFTSIYGNVINCEWSFPYIDWLLNLKPTHNVPCDDIAPAVNIF